MMAEFIQAVKWKEEGLMNRVVVYDGIFELINYCGSYKLKNLKNNDDNLFNLSAKMILRNDWEIYKEKVWNLADKKFCHSKYSTDGDINEDYAVTGGDDRVVLVNDVKTFIQKVKEDCKVHEKILIPHDEHSLQYIQGFKEGMNFVLTKQNKRAGVL